MGFEPPEEVNNFVECRPYQRAVESAIKKPFLLTTILFTHSYCYQLVAARNAVVDSLTTVYQLALGGDGGRHGSKYAEHVRSASDCFACGTLSITFRAACEFIRSSALKQLAAILLKIANDFRILGTGPRCGLNDWHLPANEPGRSIMHGKVYPTQSEALSMVCLTVFGDDLTVSLAASNGQLQLIRTAR